MLTPVNKPNFSIRFDERKLDAVFADVNQHQLPGAAVAMAIDGVPVYRKGFGLANIELPILLAPTMRMRIGSITKHFSCLAYLLLCEEGKAALDDEIGAYVPKLHASTGRRTIRELMGHISGIRDILGISMLMHGTGRVLSDEDMAGYYERIDSVDFEAGTSWSYNNGGYILLTAAIERIAGVRLDEVLRKRIFEPIGMHDTMLRRWDSDFVPNSATLHTLGPHGRYGRDYMGMEISGVGGMVSTMDDMLRWLKHMDAPTVGSTESWRLMTAPLRLRNGRSTGYGLGLMTGHYRGVEILSHGGTLMGGHAMMMKVPAVGLDISIATNRSDIVASTLAYRIVDSCVEGLRSMAPGREVETRNAIFLSQTSGRMVELSTKDNRQFMSIDGGPALPMVPDEEGALQLPAEARFLQTSLMLDEHGARLSQFGTEDPMTIVERVAEAGLDGLAGEYYAADIDVTLQVVEGVEDSRLMTRGRHGSASFRLIPRTPLIWRAEPLGPLASVGSAVTFSPDGSWLTFTSGRLDSMRFERRGSNDRP
jgi:CubicO group peptidase (beta-lactamase class C family)